MKYLPLLLVLLAFCSCSQKKAIEGYWKAEDSTIFNFRHDGTFVGRDYEGVPIWGNWVDLGHDKFGFQSLFHMGSYQPQYAVVTSADTMKYVGTAGVVFIQTKRVSEEDAAKVLDALFAAIPTENVPKK